MKDVKLYKLCEVIAGQSPPSSTYNTNGDGLPFYQGKADFGDVSPKTRMWCDAPKKIAEKNDILLSVRAPVGPTNLCRERSCIGRGLSAIRCGEDASVPYVRHYLKSIEERWDSSERGSTFSSITQDDIKYLQIPIPYPDDPDKSLAEQRRIAGILDKADAIRKKRAESLRLGAEFLKSVFLDMFGDPVTNPKGFPNCVLSDHYINDREGTKCGPFGGALKKHEYVNQGIAVWNMDNITDDGQQTGNISLWITDEKYEQLSSYSVHNGDIIISRAGTVGKMCVIHSDYMNSIISTNLIRLRLGSTLLPEFFVSLMTYCKGRVGRLKTGPDGGFTHMSTGVLDTLQFPYPPITLQEQYCNIMNSVKKSIATRINANEDADSLFHSLVQCAFRGDL